MNSTESAFLQAPLKLKLIGDPCQHYSALTSTSGSVNNDVHLATGASTR